MKQIISVALISAGAFAAGTAFETTKTFVKEQPVKQEAAYEPVTEKVIDLPQDADKWHLVLLLHDDWKERPREVRMYRWFKGDDRRLSGLADQMHFHLYTPSHKHYRTSPYSEQFPASRFPAVVMIRSDGWGAFIRSGQAVPDTPLELGNDIADCWPRPEPEPTPEPVTPDLPDTPVIPDTPEPEVPEQADDQQGNDGLSLLATLLLSALLGGGGGALLGFGGNRFNI